MSEDYMNLPSVKEIKELIEVARQDIATEVEQNPDQEPSSALLTQVLEILEEKIAGKTDLKKLSKKEAISVAAHLNFFYILVDDFFGFAEDDVDFDDEECCDEDEECCYDDEEACNDDEDDCCEEDECEVKKPSRRR